MEDAIRPRHPGLGVKPLQAVFIKSECSCVLKKSTALSIAIPTVFTIAQILTHIVEISIISN